MSLHEQPIVPYQPPETQPHEAERIVPSYKAEVMLSGGDDFRVDLSQPIADRKTVLDRLGIDGELLAIISTDLEKRFMLLNVAPDVDSPRDLLLIDESYSPEDGTGFLHIPEYTPVSIGQRQHRDRFTYPETTSREHFRLQFWGDGLTIQDLGSTNRTGVTANAFDTSSTSEAATRAWSSPQDLGYTIATPATAGANRIGDTIQIRAGDTIIQARSSESEAEAIFKRATIRGHVGLEEGPSELTPELLEKEGLLPRHKIEVGGEAIWFSQAYDIGSGRLAVIGYTEEEGSVNGQAPIVARSYYLSNSQGVWRYLPQYSIDYYWDMVNHYDKGHGEESITLPAEFQAGLALAVESDGSVLQPDYDVAQAIFIGTARMKGAEKTGYFRRVAEYPTQLAGVPNGELRLDRRGNSYYHLPPPNEVRPEGGQAPNLHAPLMTWRQRTSMYGEVTFEVVRSVDKDLKYVFCTDERGRTWISGIENNSPLDKTGVRTEWVSGGALTTPAYEYRTQAGGYGNLRDTAGSNYVDMYANYLRHIPVIDHYKNLRPQTLQAS